MDFNFISNRQNRIIKNPIKPPSSYFEINWKERGDGECVDFPLYLIHEMGLYPSGPMPSVPYSVSNVT